MGNSDTAVLTPTLSLFYSSLCGKVCGVVLMLLHRVAARQVPLGSIGYVVSSLPYLLSIIHFTIYTATVHAGWTLVITIF